MPRAQTSIAQKIIQFVGVDTGTDSDGTRVGFNIAEALEHIQMMPFSDGVGGRYMPLKDASVIHTDLYNVSPDGVALFTIRHTNRYSWPQMEDKGAVSNLADVMSVDENAGLMDTAPAVFFPGKNAGGVIGLCYSGNQSYANNLALYLVRKGGWNHPHSLRLLPLIQRDVIEQIRELEGVSLCHIRLRSSYATSVETSNLYELFNAMQGQPVLQKEVEIVIRPVEAEQARMKRFVLAILPDDVFWAHSAKTLVKGRSQTTRKTETINVLRNVLKFRCDIPKVHPRGVAVDERQAYQSIVELYRENRKSIEQAHELIGGIWPWDGSENGGTTDSLELMRQLLLL